MEALLMKYMLLIYADEQAWTEAERAQCYSESTQLAHQLKSNGQFLATGPLQPVATATTVKVRDGKRLVTDGPFAETREQLGGYFLVDAKNLDEALDIAGRIPGARKGTVEIRPLVEIPGLPTI
jgi:hypothetical protein